MNDNDLNDLFRQIGKTVQDVASPENIAELKKSIDETVREVKNAVKQGTSAATSTTNVTNTPPKAKPTAVAPPPQRRVTPTSIPTAPPAAPQKNALALPSSKIPGHASGPLLTVLGIIGTLTFGSSLFAALAAIPAVTANIVVNSCLVAFNIGITVRGTALRNRVRRYRTYLRELAGNTFCSVRSLAAVAGKSSEFVARDLKKMIRIGFFPQGHLDEQRTCLMLDNETYGQYKALMQSAKEKETMEQQRQERIHSNPELETVVREGEECLQQIREANEAIPGEEISRKLSRLESITEKIFNFVAQHPDKLPEIRKFLSYYLPTTLKLVNAYRRFDAQPLQGDNIQSSKREIEETLDTINLAFENLFDSLFEEDAMDVSADISVLETMLHQEGLTGSDFK